MKKEDQRIRLTKRLLKETLIGLLGKKDIGKISVTELCARAEINRSTFYQHYNIPKDVLLDIERDFSEKAFASLRESVASNTFEDQLTEVCALLHENAALQKIIFKNTTDAEVTKIFSDSGFPIWDTSRFFLTQQGEEMDDVSRALTSMFVNYGIFHVIREWIVNDIQKTPREIARIICNIAME